MTYQQLEELFHELRIDASPSAFHGFVCGCLSCGPLDESTFIKVSSDWLALTSEQTADAELALKDFYDAAAGSLAHPEFMFEPVLPDDELPLHERLDALGDWCSNYISGVGERMAGAFEVSAEGREALEDLAAIGRISTEFDVEGDPEQDYVELVEFIRIAVQLVFADLNDVQADEEKPTIH